MSIQSKPTSPRAYAALIHAIASQEDRKAVIQACPSDWRDLVLKHVAIAEERDAETVRQREKWRPAQKTSPAAHAAYQEPQRVRGNSEVAAMHLAGLRSSIKPSIESRA
ncbi:MULTISPECIES: hypothetical protein [Pseudomonas]|uniref:hypothetical protein n=1 Tax=Pseudomonas TaxID=286 RepID=UPI000B352C78|nr:MULTISPECIES: hypothetical protein [Pseudomonas]PMY49126.1 hypothetical protein C1X70_23325 [Pseudomonas sp. FW305-53]PMY85661.1 hypothetical protein C1X68_17825 [Pseudomonas sp. FW303-C2]PMY92867.1 hypothetical protein C1X67_10675 [Pseudomonas sp. FW305-62]PNA44380.1 hypothetical protein C1X71_08170 [Pseudomonas sp. FW306-2-2C-A10BC]PNA83041.1 hypothetical protein C1X66_25810 [Pseudomonas sp. MPR-R3B]